jgi:hypothetical protein
MFNNKEDKRLVQIGFGQVEIEKDRLHKTIIENKEKHISEYKEAIKAYEKAKLAYALEFTKQLENNIKAVKVLLDEKLAAVESAAGLAEVAYEKEKEMDLSGINAVLNLQLHPKVQLTVTKPESHEKEYNNVLRNLELTTAEYILLGTQEFNQYVLDEWSWKSSFATNAYAVRYGDTMTGNLNFSNSISGISMLGTGCYAIASGVSIGSISTGGSSAPLKISSISTLDGHYFDGYNSNIATTGIATPYTKPIYANKGDK